MTPAQREVLQELYHAYRQAIGDHKMNYIPILFLSDDERRRLVSWIRATVSESALDDLLAGRICDDDEEER